MTLEPTVVVGPASPDLAHSLAGALSAPATEPQMRRFPDGEAYCRIRDRLDGCHAVVVQTTGDDADILELLLLLDAAREAGAAQVTAVVPYLAYARQDRAFQEGEAVSVRAVARAVGTAADAVLVVDPHKESSLAHFPCPASSVSAVPVLAGRLKEWGVDAVLAPDAGARDRAERAAGLIGCPVDHLEKRRLGPSQVEMRAKDLDVQDRCVAILDDMIASGSTVLEAARQLKAQGAASVVAACTHGRFTKGALDRLLRGGLERVLCTDTLPVQGCDSVSAAPVLAAALRSAAPREAGPVATDR